MNNSKYKAGNFARLRSIPDELLKLPPETIAAFEKSLGKAFRITGVNTDGHVQIEIGFVPNFGLREIWVEAHHLEHVPILTNDAL